jgi:CTP:molybdopterin cytidylyltransferase MocA
MSRIGAALLAAGASRCLGTPEPLAPWRSSTLVRVAAHAACATRCDRVAVVLGAHAELIAPALSGLRVSILPNASWPEGLASSIRCATRWASAGAYDALLLLVCDQPQLPSAHLDALLDAHRDTGRCVASRCGGVLGVPAVITSAQFPALLALAGDRGAHSVLDGADPIGIDWPEGADDGDAVADLAALGALHRGEAARRLMR